MKSNVMPVSEQLSEETKQLLSEQVKETMAKDVIKKKKNKTFTASEMWNRHRQRKSASYMMRRWNLN